MRAYLPWMSDREHYTFTHLGSLFFLGGSLAANSERS